MKPALGRIVIYNTTKEDTNQLTSNGAPFNIQDKVPAIIVAVWGDTEASAVNLQVMIDGAAGTL